MKQFMSSPHPSHIDAATRTLLEDKIVFMPTDTVYGLVTRIHAEYAAQRVQRLKGREFRPGTFLFANEVQLVDFGFPADMVRQAHRFWPGPVSVILPYKGAYLDGTYESLAVRIPADRWLRKLLLKTGPLATTSANRTGEPTVLSVQEARRLFGDEISYYLDAGVMEAREPSKIVKMAYDGTIEIIRG